MSNTIPLYENAHATTQRLLPWYVNGALDDSERELVEAHLVNCAECRAELDAEHQLEADVASLALDVDQGWAKMQARIAAQPTAPWLRILPRSGSLLPGRQSALRTPSSRASVSIRSLSGAADRHHHTASSRIQPPLP